MRALRLWGVYDPIKQTRAEAIESRQEGWQLFGWAYWIVLLPFAITGALWLRRQVDLTPFIAVMAGVTLLAMLSWGNQRFRLPAEPLVLVLAAAGLHVAIAAVRRRWRSCERDVSIREDAPAHTGL